MATGSGGRLEGGYAGDILGVLQRSLYVDRHVDFFRWLREEVYEFLPHEVLVAVWGDFASGRLRYDVSSDIPEIRTRNFMSCCDTNDLMCNLYDRWVEGGQRWYVMDDFSLTDMSGKKSDACVATLGRMKSVLVHGIPDRRGNHDCLYVFFDRESRIHAPQAAMELLLPQIDAALRRVECLPEANAEEADEGALYEVSEREREIMTWVKLGKTNQEIGMILGISPNTVKNHLKRIFRKLDVSTRAQAVAKYGSSRPGM